VGGWICPPTQEDEGDVMNKRLLVLAPLLAIVAFTVMPALAQASGPEFGRCLKSAGAGTKYKHDKCTGTASLTGEYEWTPVTYGQPIVGESTKKSYFYTKPPEGFPKVVCNDRKVQSAGASFFMTPDEAIEAIEFSHCYVTSEATEPCDNTTAVLKSVIGFIPATDEVAVGLEEDMPGLFVQFDCHAASGLTQEVVVRGRVLGRILPSDRMRELFKEEFKPGAGYKQAVSELETVGGPPPLGNTLECALLGAPFEPCAWDNPLETISAPMGEQLEINTQL
jgi:hypothetical protein